MNHERKCSWTTEENCDEPERLRATQNKLKINRLKRSPKTNHTQPSDINSTAETDFKTPTRVTVGFRSAITEESPNNDPELQHEIIWDPTSPTTPIRNGRGRRKTTVKTVDIADIVNRIAPKNKRPEEMESSLLQWIGDTAVPCTPEIRIPRTKTRLTRQNSVADLLKLAKQFDFNMIQQVETQLRPDPQNSVEVICVEEDLFFDKNNPTASPPTCSEVQGPALVPEDPNLNSIDPLANPGLVQEMEDDLNLLFDGSTQQVSGRLSLGCSASSQDVVKFTPQCGANLAEFIHPCSATRVSRASETTSGSVHMAASIPSTIKQMGAADDFDDDWNNDDLLNDSLVMELTQNPELFSAPQCSSTQKQMSKNESSASIGYHQNGKEVKSGEVQRMNQRLGSFQHAQHWSKVTEHTSFKVPSVVISSHSVFTTNLPLKTAIEIQQPVATTSCNSTWKAQPATTTSSVSISHPSRFVPSAMQLATTFTIDKVTEEKERHPIRAHDVLGDLAAEDLDSIFASDDIWDEGPDDDNLFCEACEKLEESMAEPDLPLKISTTKPTQRSSSGENIQSTLGEPQSVLIRPFSSNAQIYNCNDPGNQVLQSTHGVPNNTVVLDNHVTRSSDQLYKFTHVKSTTGTGSTTYYAARQVSNGAMATIDQANQRIEGDLQFKKPNCTFNAGLTATKDVSKEVVTRCSDAEIERKKQQAMERRRLRKLANQNL